MAINMVRERFRREGAMRSVRMIWKRRIPSRSTKSNSQSTPSLGWGEGLLKEPLLRGQKKAKIALTI